MCLRGVGGGLRFAAGLRAGRLLRSAGHRTARPAAPRTGTLLRSGRLRGLRPGDRGQRRRRLPRPVLRVPVRRRGRQRERRTRPGGRLCRGTARLLRRVRVRGRRVGPARCLGQRPARPPSRRLRRHRTLRLTGKSALGRPVRRHRPERRRHRRRQPVPRRTGRLQRGGRTGSRPLLRTSGSRRCPGRQRGQRGPALRGLPRPAPAARRYRLGPRHARRQPRALRTVSRGPLRSPARVAARRLLRARMPGPPAPGRLRRARGVRCARELLPGPAGAAPLPAAVGPGRTRGGRRDTGAPAGVPAAGPVRRLVLAVPTVLAARRRVVHQHRQLQHIRAAARAGPARRPRHFVCLHQPAVQPDDPAHQRLMDRIAAPVRPAYLDPYDLAALGRRHHDRRVTGDRPRTATRPDGGRTDRHPPRGVHPRDVRDQMRQRLRQPLRIDHRRYRRRMHRELRPPGADQLDRALHTGRDHRVQRDPHAVELLLAGVQPLVAEDVVHQRRHPGVPGREMVQDLVRLGPQLARRVGRQGAQLTAQLLQRPAQRLPQHRQQLGVPCHQRVVRPPVGERHHGAHELVAVPHRRRRQVDRHRTAVLRPQRLPAHPVLAPGLEGVGERRVLPRERRAVRPRVVDQRVQLLAAQLARPVAQDLRGGRVDEYDLALGVDPDDTLRRGPQDHLGLPLLAGQLGLGVHRPGQVPHDEHQQLVAGVAVAVVGVRGLEGGLVRGAAVLQIGAGHLDQQLGPVRTPRHHPRRLRPVRHLLLPAPHGAGDPLGVEGRQEVEQPAPDEGGARRLEGLQRDGVGVDDGAVAVHEQQRVGEGVEYGCEASSASGWPAAHDDASSLLPHLADPPGGSLGWSLRALPGDAEADDGEVMPRHCATHRTPDMCPAS